MVKKPRKNKKIVKKETIANSVSELILSQLQKWAHEGTKESIKKIEDLMDRETNKELLSYAELAFDEALCFYYTPTNERDEKDFLTAKLITEREKAMWRKMAEIEILKFELSKMDIEREVHRKLLANVSKKEMEEWQYNFSEDFYIMERNSKDRLEDDIAYETAWLAVARKTIKNKKYQDVPSSVFDHIHWDGEDNLAGGKGVRCTCGCEEEGEEGMLTNSIGTYLSSPNPVEDYKPTVLKGGGVKIEDLPF